MDYLDCEIIETHEKVDASIIWLHGLGASGHDFAPIIPRLELRDELAIRFIFPHAPSLAVTINGGAVMPAWYDIYAMDMERKIDLQQIMASSAAISALIDREIESGVPSNRIIIAGFSQGGAVAFQTALSYPQTLAGLMSLSSYFATHKTIEPSAENSQLPIAIYQGTHDTIVPELLGQHAVSSLKTLGYTADYKTYPMAHEVHPQEIADIAQFIDRLLA